jgi:hypothetical protein
MGAAETVESDSPLSIVADDTVAAARKSSERAQFFLKDVSQSRLWASNRNTFMSLAASG